MAASGSTVVWGQVQEVWFEAVNHFSRSTAWLHTPARLYAEYGVVLFAGLLIGSWLLARHDRDLPRVAAALWAPFGVLVALGINQFLVAAVAEQRPYTVLPHALVLVSRSTDYSFPSDHAVAVGAAAVGVLAVHRRLGLLAAALAVLMAFTRVYVGAHFPLDVVAGLVVGAVVAFGTTWLARPLVYRLVLLLAKTPVRAVVIAHSPSGTG